MKYLAKISRESLACLSSLFSGKYRFLFISYLLVNFALFLYSFTQVDLSLVFSRSAVLREVIKSFQYIGYFDRPLSSFIYVSLVLALFTYYVIFLRLVRQKKITTKQLWGLLICIVPFFVMAYNGFSYDLFNYIFDAKILTFYHQNPYAHMALDYPKDPMLTFMHWTHRTYPYGPVWLAMTAPLSFVALQYFIPTFYLFKLLMALSFMGTVYYIGKISDLWDTEKKVMNMVFFAFNPLVLIESLISAHNDIVMMFMSVIALYVLLKKKYLRSLFYLLLSIGIKFATFLVSPVFLLLGILIWRRKRYSYGVFVLLAISTMCLGVVLASFRTTFQPWYLLYILPFAALRSQKFYISIPGVVLPLFALLMYLPFIYTGNWNPPIPSILNALAEWGIFVSVGGILLYAGFQFVDKKAIFFPWARRYLLIWQHKK